MQPWQEEVLEIALKIDVKISEFKATQTTVASLLEAPVTAKLVDTARECVNQIDIDLAELKTGLNQFTAMVKKVLKESKTTRSGSRTSHKFVLGACWSPGLHLRESFLILRKINTESSTSQRVQRSKDVAKHEK